MVCREQLSLQLVPVYAAVWVKVTVHTPKKNYDIMQISVPEAILQMDHEETAFTEAVDTDDFDALAIGPGLGRQEPTAIA